MMSKNKKNLEVKITDFGFATSFDPIKGNKNQIGTTLYMAPELQKSEKYFAKVDVWAVGCIVHAMLSGKNAFNGINDHEIKMMIVDEAFVLKKRNFNNLSQEGSDFIL